MIRSIAGSIARPLAVAITGASGGGSGGDFTPSSLFASSEGGVWYDPSNISSLYQDDAGTTPVTAAAQTVGLMEDQSPNGIDAVQATVAARPTYQTSPARLTLDKVDDRLIATIPSGGYTGTMVIGTPEGTAAYGVTIPAGSYDIGGDGGDYFPGSAIVGWLIRDGALTSGEIADLRAWMIARGAGDNYGSVTDFSGFWRGRSELTSFPLIDTSSGESFATAWNGCSGLTSFPLIDTSSGESFATAWQSCSGLTSFPLIDTSSGESFSSAWRICSGLTSFPAIDTSSGRAFINAWQYCSDLTSFPAIDTSSGTDFRGAWNGCSSLTSFPANVFDSTPATKFTNAFTNTALDQTSIDNILTSIDTANTSNGTFNQSGGSAPSATGEAAIDNLRARGWTVTVTGGY